MATLADYATCTRERDGTWRRKIGISNFARLREFLGDDILTGLSRLLVGVNRLDTLNRLLTSDLPIADYDRNTLALYALATMREMSKAVDILVAHRFTERLEDKGSWIELRKILRKCNHDADICYVRDKMAFHVDENIIRAGLSKITDGGESVVLDSGSGSDPSENLRVELGTDVLLAGCKFDLNSYTKLFEIVSPYHLQLPSLIYSVVMDITLPPPST